MNLKKAACLSITPICLVILTAVGCTKKAQKPETAQPSRTATPGTTPAQRDVLIEVDGKKLTRAQQEMEVENMLAGVKSKMQPQQVQEVTQRIRDHVVNRFVVTTLLVNEANRRNITASKEEEEGELAKTKDMLPQGMTMEELMKNTPGGEEQLRDQVQTSFKINKLIAQDTKQITKEEISDFYEKNKENLSVPENVHARHILIAVAADDNDTVKAEKKKQAEKIRRELADGSNFAELAKQYSDCPSKQMGGSLGRFKRGQMVKPFENVAFNLETNTISPVVETPFGFHIIEVLEHNDAAMLSREEVMAVVEKQKKEKTVVELVEKLKQKADIKDYRTMNQPPSPR